MLKGRRYLFLKNYKNPDDKGRQALPSLSATFEDLGRIYVFKESMRGFWEMPSKHDAQGCIMKWCEDAKAEGIPELNRIVERVTENILNRYPSRIRNGVMEAFNSVLQAFKGRARGYRSFKRYRTMIYLRGSGLC